MTGLIGETAGKVWHALQGKEYATPAQLKKTTGADEKSLWLALGWLAREDKITITRNKSSYKVSLKG